MSVSPARAAALAALRRLRTADVHLDDTQAALPELSGLSAADRGLANELIIGTVKRRATLDAILGAFTRAPLTDADVDVRDIMRMTAYQLLFLDRIPAYAAVDDAVALVPPPQRRARAFVNAVLRRVAREGNARLAALDAGGGAREWAAALSYPTWLVKLLRRDLGERAARDLLEAGNAAPERCLRVNTLRADVGGAREALAAEGFATHGVEGLPAALLYEGPPLERSRAVREGLVTPQSRGSQVAGVVAAAGVSLPGAAVCDLCAAPGTKTVQLAALLPTATITAVEADEARAAMLRGNLARLGAARVDVRHGDALELPSRLDETLDAVLLDAPCSGFGSLAARADLRWRRRAADVPRLAGLQARLLLRAAALIKPGGTLTYSVCTVTRAETLAVVEPLLAGGGWAVDDLGAAWPQLRHPEAGGFLLALPPVGGSTAFFIARLRRAGGVHYEPRRAAAAATEWGYRG